MGIEIDFGRELGRLAFPDDITEEQAQNYARENYQAIRQGLIAKRQEQLAAETEAEEAAKFRAGEYGAVETALNTLSELPRGVLEGLGGTLKGFATTFEGGDPFTEVPTEERLRLVEKSPITEAGKTVQEFGRETYPGLPGVRETLPAQIMGGIGSTVSTLPAALVAGPAAPLGGAIAYGLQAGQAASEEADTTINRRIAEAMARQEYDLAADLQDRREQMKSGAFVTTAPLGVITEGALGAGGKVVRRFATGRIGGIGTRLAEGLVPKSAKFQQKFLGVTGAERVRGAVEAAVTEGAQESLEQFGGNIAAGAVYDPDRGWLDGVAQAGLVGAASGGVVGGFVGSQRSADLADAAVESVGGNPDNPLPRANATVAGIEDELTPDIAEELGGINAGGPPSGPIRIQPEPAIPAAVEEAIAPPAEPIAPIVTEATVQPEPQPLTPSAIQEQGPDEGLLRGEEPQPEVQVGLPEVDQGGRPPEGAGAEAEAPIVPEELIRPPEEISPVASALPPAEPTPVPAPKLVEPTKKAAEEELESQIVEATAQTVREDRSAGVDPTETYDKLAQRYEEQPQLGTRTASSKTAQAYSTPPPLAYLAGILADVEGGQRVAETTAGNGMLLVTSDPTKQDILANELDPNRRTRLERFIGKPATGLDAVSQEFFNSLDSAQPDRVIINPPFGARFIEGQKESFPLFRSTIKRAQTSSIDLAIALNTLEAMAPNGKAVLILGSKTGSQSNKLGTPENRLRSYERAEYLDLFNRFNVTDFFTIDGSMYSKMGAGWPVDIVVIDGKRSTPPAAQGGLVRPWISAPRVYNSWADLKPLINEARKPKVTTPVTPAATGVGNLPAVEPAVAGGGEQPGGVPGAPARPEIVPQGQRAEPAPVEQPVPGPGPVVPSVQEQRPVAPSEPAAAGPVVEPAAAVQQPGAAGVVAGGRPEPVVNPPTARPGLTAKLSTEDQAQLEALKKQLREKLGGVGMGVDPEIIVIGARMAALYVKAGIRTFAEFASQVRADLPEIWDKLKRSLLAIWQETANTVEGLDDLNRTQATGVIDAIDQATVPTEPEIPVEPETDAEPEVMSEARTKPYKSQSKNAETGLVSPSNIADATERALRELEAEVKMPIDEYVANRLQMTKDQLFKTMSAAQIDAAGLAIRNIERGSALINSDQTGVGKGRTVAAVLRYARLNGLTPVFITAKPTLYSDMAGRDLPAIGETSIRPYVTNSNVDYLASTGETVKVRRTATKAREELAKINDTAELPAGSNAFFTTYDQLKADVPQGFKEVAKQRRQRQSKRVAKPFGPIWQALSRIAPNAIFVLDEAHLAAGANSDTNIRFDQVLPKSKGAYFASATFAKRPDNLGLYALKTLMQRAGLRPTEMTELLDSGGLALQQALTSMLAESGEFVRREQNWGGVPFDFVTSTDNAERERELADVYTDFLQQILRFSKKVSKVAKKMENAENQTRASEEKVSVSSTNFGSQLFNLSTQYILSLKAKAIADNAIQTLKGNEKPFIAINNTMEGPIETLKEEGYDVSYKGLLLRQLDKLLEVTVRDKAADTKTTIKITPDELPDDARQQYEDIRDEIEGGDFGDMPISPIDFIKNRIQQAGYSIDEITGRNTEIVTTPDGKATSVPRKKRDRRVVLDDFNNGRLDAILVNKSGSTGTSAHTDPKFKDQRRRVMIVGQAAPDINDFMQMLGRIMRFGQTSLPRYVVLSSSLAAENRFMVLLRRKMASLNANTSADTESDLTANEGLVADIFNSIGDDVVYNVLKSNPEIVDQMDFSLPPLEEGIDEGGDFARSATGYFVILPDDYAAKLWRDISELYTDRIRALDEVGENPLKANVDDLRAKTVESSEFTPGTGTTPFDGPSVMERVSIKPPKAPPTYEAATEEAAKNRATTKAIAEGWIKQSRAFEQQRVAAMEAKEVTPAQIQSVKDAFEETRQMVISAYQKIGRAFKNQFGYVAVPIGLKLKSNDPGNFTRPSDHQLLLMRNMVRSRASMPLSMSEGAEGASSLGEQVSNAAEEWQTTTETTDQRYVVTGNLLKGFQGARGASEVRPKITIYTTNTGKRKTGILMPANFTPERKVKDIRVPREEAISLLRGGTEIFAKGESEGAKAAELLRIKPLGGGKYEVRIRAGNALRPVWSNPSVQRLFPDNLVQKGSFLVGTMDAADAPSLMSLAEQINPDLGRLMYDKVENLLNRAIQATRPQGSYESTAAIPLAVINLALRAARAVYIKTRDIVQARQAAIQYVRENAPANTDFAAAEVEIGQLIEGAFETPGTGAFEQREVQPPRAAAGQRRRPSAGFFQGRIVRETNAERKAAAREWVDQYGDDIEEAFTAATGGNRATQFGITPALQQTILGELIERTAARVQASFRNPIDQQRWVYLLRKIGEVAAQSGAQDFGQSGQARRAMISDIDYLTPALTYYNLINERQKEIPFPEVSSDQIRRWLLDASKRAIANIRSTLSIADNVVSRELKQARRELGVSWEDIMTSSLDKQGNYKRILLDVISEHPILRTLSRAGQIELANLLGNAFEKERNKIVREEFKKQVKLPEVKEKVRKKIYDSIPNIIKWANLGLLTNPEAAADAFRNAIAPKFGVAQINGETAQKISDMAQRAQRTGGTARNKIIQEMYQLMQREGGIRARNIIMDYWYGSVLSGLTTAVEQGTGIINSMINAGLASVQSPTAAPYIASAWLDGMRRSFKDVPAIFARGEMFRGINFDPERPTSTLEALKDSDNMALKAISNLRFVSRFMDAMDHVAVTSNYEAMKAWIIARGGDTKQIREFLIPDASDVQLAREKAESEGLPAERVNQRVREILEARIPSEILIDAKELARQAAFKQDPTGIVGLFYQWLNQAEKKYPGVKMVTGLAFLRFAANATNSSIDWLPWGFTRYYMSNSSRINKPFGYQISDNERKLLLMKASIGTALMAMAGALFLGDDDKEEDRNIDITGSYRSLDPDKKRQLLAQGRQPYSIRIGDKFISYRQMPFAMGLAAIGELRDHQLHNPKEWNRDAILGKFKDAAQAGMFVLTDSPAISAFTELVGMTNAYKYNADDLVNKDLSRWAGRLAGSFIPNILKQVDTYFDPQYYQAKLGSEYFLQQVPMLRRDIGAGPMVNVLGEPVEMMKHPFSRWIKTRKDDPAWNTLATLSERGVFLPSPSAAAKVSENGTRRQMTPEEFYRYQREVGQQYREYVLRKGPQLLAVTPDQAIRVISQDTERIRARIREKIDRSVR
jgi:hypothetical protein